MPLPINISDRIIAREYRNRRIGDFLKGLKLTEGRGTGVPAIYKAMAANGSDKPSFETDESTYVLVTLPAISSNQINGASNGVKILLFRDINDLVNYSNGASNGADKEALDLINIHIHDRVYNLLFNTTEWINRGALFDILELSNQSTNRKKYLDPLLDLGWIQLEYPNNLTHPNQRYMITKSGNRILKILSGK